MKMERNYSIDALRFIFILCICIMHYNWKFLPQAYLGVEVCFVISGLLLAFNYDVYQKKSIFSIMKEKILRIYPVYVCTLILYCVAFREWQVEKLLDNFFFLSVFNYSGMTTLMCVAHWYIMVYVWLSLLFVLLMKKLKKQKTSVIITGIAFISYMSLRNQFDHINIVFEYSMGVIPVSFIRGIIGMGLGYTLGIWYMDEGGECIERMSEMLCKVFSVGCGIFFLYVFRHEVTPKYDFIIEVPIIILMCTVLKTYKKRTLLDRLGHLSICKYGMAVYLVHPVVLKIMQKCKVEENVYNLLFYLGWVIAISVIFTKIGECIKQNGNREKRIGRKL